LRREALAEINQAVMLEPRNAEYQFLLGECLEANGDYQNAHQAYLTCVLIDPENNKEAAARMKAMQTRAHDRPTVRFDGNSDSQPKSQAAVLDNHQWQHTISGIAASSSPVAASQAATPI